MKRTLLALCTAVLTCAHLGASPASAYVGEYSFSDRGGDRVAAATSSRTARSQRTSRAQRAARQSWSVDDATPVRSSRRSARRTASLPSLTGSSFSGIASYYWQPQRVASGGWFNPNAMTAAHRTLPFGTRVRVTNLNNGRSVTVTINDRGPFIAGRVIDLSRAAAQAVGMTGAGLARVNIAVVGRG